MHGSAKDSDFEIDNPFAYGTVVTGTSFASREREIAELLLSIRSGKAAVIHSQRRMGKTSILAELAGRYSDDFIFVYLDMRCICDENSFIERFTKASLEAGFPEVEELIPAIWDLVGSARLRLAILEDGRLGLTGSRDSETLVLAQSGPAQGDKKRDSTTVEIKMCPRCGMSLKWIEKYNRHYCYRCKKYAPKQRTPKYQLETSVESPPPKVCPACGGRLHYVARFDEHYCDVCKKYPLIEYRMKKRQKPSDEEIIEMLDLPDKIAAQKKMHLVAIFDEFQEMLTFDSSRLLNMMRSRFDMHNHASYIFSTCDWNKTKRIFEEKEGELFRFAHPIDLRGIAENNLEDFLVARYRSGGGALDREVAKRIIDVSGGHPYYAQQIAHELFHMSKTPTVVEFDRAVRLALKRHCLGYSFIWESIRSSLHRRYLLGIAAEPGVPHGKDFVQRHGLKSRSHVQRIEKQLGAKGIVTDGEILDPMFLLWLRDMAQL
jgi:predicted RNA-binding Zn-ribbon protein involved in translation (DUF1610 family)